MRGATTFGYDFGGSMPKFQFTHPVRGPTPVPEVVGLGVEVSIHAPREGCDNFKSAQDTISPAFQFTHPVRGATNAPFEIFRDKLRFNSRTP